MTNTHCVAGRLTGTPARGVRDLTLGRASQGALPSGVSGATPEPLSEHRLLMAIRALTQYARDLAGTEARRKPATLQRFCRSGKAVVA